MYVDYSYYQNEYGGKMTQERFQAMERKAEACIRYLTYVNGDVFSVQNDVVKDAVCAASDVYEAFFRAKAEREQDGRQGALKSENTDGYSVSYVTEQTDGQTEEEAVRKKAYDAVYPYLLPTGWLSRKVRCRHGDECGYHGL